VILHEPAPREYRRFAGFKTRIGIRISPGDDQDEQVGPRRNPNAFLGDVKAFSHEGEDFELPVRGGLQAAAGQAVATSVLKVAVQSFGENGLPENAWAGLAGI
jgi:hypothetical protein